MSRLLPDVTTTSAGDALEEKFDLRHFGERM